MNKILVYTNIFDPKTMKRHITLFLIIALLFNSHLAQAQFDDFKYNPAIPQYVPKNMPLYSVPNKSSTSDDPVGIYASKYEIGTYCDKNGYTVNGRTDTSLEVNRNKIDITFYFNHFTNNCYGQITIEPVFLLNETISRFNAKFVKSSEFVWIDYVNNIKYIINHDSNVDQYYFAIYLVALK